MAISGEVPPGLISGFLSSRLVPAPDREVRFPVWVFPSVLGSLFVNGCHGCVDICMSCIQMVSDADFPLVLCIACTKAFVTPGATPVTVLKGYFVSAYDRLTFEFFPFI